MRRSTPPFLFLSMLAILTLGLIVAGRAQQDTKNHNDRKNHGGRVGQASPQAHADRGNTAGPAGPAVQDSLASHASHAGHTGHTGHTGRAGKEDQVGQGGHESHDGHESHEGHEGHEGHTTEGEEEIELTPEQEEEIGLALSQAGPGELRKELKLSGSIGLNEDNVVHLVPRAPGIAISVKKTSDEDVKKGEVLAVLESTELADAKSAYVELYNDFGCVRVDLDRTRIVVANTRKLLAFLKKEPTLADLRKTGFGDLGPYRTRLLNAYSEYCLCRKTYERQQQLQRDRISSKKDYLEAQNSFEKAEAVLTAEMDNAHFEVDQLLLEGERKMRVVGFKVKAAERKLHMMGLAASEILALQAGLTPEVTAAHCPDPNCKTCVERRKNTGTATQDHFAQVLIRAPIDGTIIKKHLSLGEKITDSEVFTIADLKTVWALLKIPARDVSLVKEGDLVEIESPDGYRSEGQIFSISRIMDEETRTAIARVILDNARGNWKPGTYVNGNIHVSAKGLPLVIPKPAVQNLQGEDIVFVLGKRGYRSTPVTLGQSDRDRIEIISGLKPGMIVVTKGAFALKAKILTSSMDSHAGHGH